MNTNTTTPQIDDFLRRLHLGTEVYYVGQMCEAWQLASPGGAATTFHLVCHGEAWIHMPGVEDPVLMRSGDIGFFAHDAAHAISSTRQRSGREVQNYGVPQAFNPDSPGTGLVCGHLKLPVHIRRLLLASFPEFMLIRSDHSPAGKRMRGLIEIMSEEAVQNGPGATAILDRLSDALFLYAIRHILQQQPELSPLLAAVSDPHLRLAVTAFIENPEEPWTVERLAAHANQSRSTFSEHFTRLISMPPMEFVATWRMQLATGWLAETDASMLDIAMRCGYESEAAFRKAFKRIIGVPPGKMRTDHTSISAR